MDTIITLKGPDRVRRRPAVAFGSDGQEGAEAVVRYLLNIFLHEAARGHSRRLAVTLGKDGTVTVHSSDRGFCLDDTPLEGKPRWWYSFCEMYTPLPETDPFAFTEREVEHEELYSIDRQPVVPGYGMEPSSYYRPSWMQYVSDRMEVEAVRDGVRRQLRFEKGYPVGELQKSPCADAPYTRIRFRPDPAVFSDVTLRPAMLRAYLQDAAVTVAGLTCTLTDEATGVTEQFLHPQGAVSLAAEAAKRAVTPVFTKTIEATGRERYNKPEYTARVTLTLRFVREGGDARCYHNLRRLTAGGTHLQAVQKRSTEYLNWQLELPQDKTLTWEAIAPHCLLVLESCSTGRISHWKTGRADAIASRLIAEIATDLAGEDFRYFVKQNEEALAALFDAQP